MGNEKNQAEAPEGDPRRMTDQQKQALADDANGCMCDYPDWVPVRLEDIDELLEGLI